MVQSLNETLSCLFVLTLAYLHLDYEESRHGALVAQREYDRKTLATLESYGLVMLSSDNDAIALTREGEREARGMLKYLQLTLGPKIGATALDIRDEHPRLYADEATDGAGPLTMAELAYALAGVGHTPPAPARVEVPDVNPLSLYGRNQEDSRAFVLRVCLGYTPSWRYSSYPSYESAYWGAPSEYNRPWSCWRDVLVPAGFTFLDLHLVIQQSLSWTDQQAFGFLVSRGKRNHLIGEPFVWGETPRPNTSRRKFQEEYASRTYLGSLLSRTYESLSYRYGTWDHSITVEEVREGAGRLGPQLLDGVGDAPPEWVKDADEFATLRNTLYQDRRQMIKTLAGMREGGFTPFDLDVARERFSGFEGARASWQRLLSGQGEKRRAADGGAPS